MQVVVFLNSVLLLNQLNQVVVIATGFNTCDYVYNLAAAGALPNQRVESLLQKLVEFVVKDKQLGKEDSVDGIGSSLLSGSLYTAGVSFRATSSPASRDEPLESELEHRCKNFNYSYDCRKDLDRFIQMITGSCLVQLVLPVPKMVYPKVVAAVLLFPMAVVVFAAAATELLHVSCQLECCLIASPTAVTMKLLRVQEGVPMPQQLEGFSEAKIWSLARKGSGFEIGGIEGLSPCNASVFVSYRSFPMSVLLFFVGREVIPGYHTKLLKMTLFGNICCSRKMDSMCETLKCIDRGKEKAGGLETFNLGLACILVGIDQIIH
ncbi:hypothetical protein RHSIM_RhsimUnG0102200 [Rhododendron simsii]|uniref:Uncharacterized protein n=1 Tax=Rhododendron simsii TaxID=118357 RepID=A0A834G1K4_RHOSS|nr:hypothetical protein RHSIM_RhsimUnG0102200 [Rhododendron simsii]